jgi:hypothetical protein
VALQLQSSGAGIRGLTERLDTLAAYIAAVQQGQVPPDRGLLRQIAAVVARVPVSDAPAFHAAAAADLADSLAAAHAAALTKGGAALASLAAKLRVAHAEAKEKAARRDTAAMLGGLGAGAGMGGMMRMGRH